MNPSLQRHRKKSARRTTFYIVIGIVCLLVGIGLTLKIVTFKKGEKENEATQVPSDHVSKYVQEQSNIVKKDPKPEKLSPSYEWIDPTQEITDENLDTGDNSELPSELPKKGNNQEGYLQALLSSRFKVGFIGFCLVGGGIIALYTRKRKKVAELLRRIRTHIILGCKIQDQHKKIIEQYCINFRSCLEKGVNFKTPFSILIGNIERLATVEHELESSYEIGLKFMEVPLESERKERPKAQTKFVSIGCSEKAASVRSKIFNCYNKFPCILSIEEDEDKRNVMPLNVLCEKLFEDVEKKERIKDKNYDFIGGIVEKLSMIIEKVEKIQTLLKNSPQMEKRDTDLLQEVLKKVLKVKLEGIDKLVDEMDRVLQKVTSN